MSSLLAKITFTHLCFRNVYEKATLTESQNATIPHTHQFSYVPDSLSTTHPQGPAVAKWFSIQNSGRTNAHTHKFCASCANAKMPTKSGRAAGQSQARAGQVLITVCVCLFATGTDTNSKLHKKIKQQQKCNINAECARARTASTKLFHRHCARAPAQKTHQPASQQPRMCSTRPCAQHACCTSAVAHILHRTLLSSAPASLRSRSCSLSLGSSVRACGTHEPTASVHACACVFVCAHTTTT